MTGGSWLVTMGVGAGGELEAIGKEPGAFTGAAAVRISGSVKPGRCATGTFAGTFAFADTSVPFAADRATVGRSAISGNASSRDDKLAHPITHIIASDGKR